MKSKHSKNKKKKKQTSPTPTKQENPLAHIKEFEENYKQEEESKGHRHPVPEHVNPKEEHHRAHMEPVLERSAKTFARHGETCILWEGEGNKVQIAGDWNKWHPVDMRKSNEELRGPWVFPVKLSPGKHEFKFVIDGVWKYDPERATCVDADKNINNFISIPEETEKPEETM